MTARVLSSSTFFGPLSNKSLEVLGSTSVDILWILYPFEEGIGGSKILSLGGYSMLSRNITLCLKSFQISHLSNGYAQVGVVVFAEHVNSKMNILKPPYPS